MVRDIPDQKNVQSIYVHDQGCQWRRAWVLREIASCSFRPFGLLSPNADDTQPGLAGVFLTGEGPAPPANQHHHPTAPSWAADPPPRRGDPLK